MFLYVSGSAGLMKAGRGGGTVELWGNSRRIKTAGRAPEGLAGGGMGAGKESPLLFS